MGLDMYLTGRIGLDAGEFCTLHRKDGTTEEFRNCFDDCRFITLSVDVAYWRKADQIHRWFQDNINTDDGYVSIDDLMRLKETCSKILKAEGEERLRLAEDELPPTIGCFSDDYEINDVFLKQLEYTVDVLSGIPPNTYEAFYYCASW